MALYRGFCQGSNPTQSIVADAERTVNWYPEVIQSAGAPTTSALFPTPGLLDYTTVDTQTGSRGAFSENGRAFEVVGDGFFEVFSPAASVRRGTVAQDNNLATISSNGVAGGQLFITSAGNGYCYVLATNTLTQVLTNEATQGGSKDGYFLAFNRNNGHVRLSALNDGTTWDPTQFFARSIAPDPWRAMIVANPLIYMLGEYTSEAWYNAGNVPQPFAPILSSFIPYGTGATWSAAVAGSKVVFLGQDQTGTGFVLSIDGYSPQIISNYAVSTSLSALDKAFGIQDCEILVYEQEGHLFANLTFALANQTWTIDLQTGQWHERGTWNSLQARYDYWHPRTHMLAFGRHLVGDRDSGKISELSLLSSLESDGSYIRRLRSGPPLWASSKQRLRVSRFSLFMDTGNGISSGQGYDPQVMLRTSGDGHNWSSERQCSSGPMGNYGRNVFWTRCGSSDKLWMPEVSVSDPVGWRLSGAELDGDGFYLLGQAN